METKEARVLFRDDSGRHSTITGSSFTDLYVRLLRLNDTAEEILLVEINGQIVWTALNGEPLTLEDLLGFFA